MHTRNIGHLKHRMTRVPLIAAIGLPLLLAGVLLLLLVGTSRAAEVVADEPPQLTVNYTYNWVGVEAEASQDVTVVVKDKASISGSTGENGRFASHEWSWDPDQPQIVPGDTVTGTVNGTIMVVDPVGRITGSADYDANTVSGKIFAPWFSPDTLTVRCEVWVENGPSGVEIEGVDPDGGSYTCDFTTEGWNLQADQLIAVFYIQPNGHRVNTVLEPPRLTVNYGHNWVEISGDPSVPVTVTLAGKATVSGMTDEDGHFISFDWPWIPENPGIVPGDIVTASLAGSILAINPVGSISGLLDFEADTVSGSVNAPWLSPAAVNVRCEVWEEDGPDGIEIADVDPDGGSYSCDFSTVDWDLQTSHTVAVRYEQPDGNQVINVFEAPSVRVNYGDDWVGADYEVGHTFLITVTDSADAVKAVAEIETVPGGGWGSDGFQSEGDDWQPQQPDIQPGDWVRFSADDGYTNLIRVGEINGTVDVDNNSISGPIHAEWFTETLNVQCHPWGAWPGPATVQNSTADPDGGAPYSCGWDGVWDVQPGQNIAVFYEVPDTRDLVGNVFRGTASRYVAGTGSDANDNPCTDPATPCRTLQHAIDKASRDDSILVAEGTYAENISIHSDGLTVRGGYAISGTEWIADRGETIIESVENESIVRIEGTNILLEHLTITGAQTDSSGGGVSARGGSTVELIDLKVHGNSADAGGGVEVRDGSTVKIVDTEIYANTATGHEGGGILVEGSNVKLIRSRVMANSATNNEGGGIGAENSSIHVENSIIAGNNSGTHGGGFWILGGEPSTIVNSHIIGNSTSGEGGAAAAKASAHVVITNTLIISNTGNTGIAGRDGEGSFFDLNYCDTYGNRPDGVNGVTITRDNCLGSPATDGLDPQMAGGPLPAGTGSSFAAAWMAYDYRPAAGSPTIDAGSNVGAPDVDIAGHSRPQDGDTDGNEVTDMGAYELVLKHIYLPITFAEE